MQDSHISTTDDADTSSRARVRLPKYSRSIVRLDKRMADDAEDLPEDEAAEKLSRRDRDILRRVKILRKPRLGMQEPERTRIAVSVALDMHCAGRTAYDIANLLDCTRDDAHALIRSGLDALSRVDAQNAQQIRHSADAQLAYLQAKAMERIEAGDPDPRLIAEARSAIAARVDLWGAKARDKDASMADALTDFLGHMHDANRKGLGTVVYDANVTVSETDATIPDVPK